jgi:hypothetical protein
MRTIAKLRSIGQEHSFRSTRAPVSNIHRLLFPRLGVLQFGIGILLMFLVAFTLLGSSIGPTVLMHPGTVVAPSAIPMARIVPYGNCPGSVTPCP